jgi:hypothetical protein
MSIDHSISATYSFTLNLYLTFCKSHGLPVEPNTQTLSYYFQSFYINPKSVDSYLSGTCNQLELYFPNVRLHHKSALINCTLAGAKQYHDTPTKCKSLLTAAHLLTLTDDLASSTLHDGLLFNALFNTSITSLLCLREMTWPNKITLGDYKKVTMRFSMEWTKNMY